MNFAGWVRVDRSILGDLTDGKISGFEYLALLQLRLLADASTGGGVINAPLLTYWTGYIFSQDTAQRILLRLHRNGYIWYRAKRNTKCPQPYWIHAYCLSKGQCRLRITNLSKLASKSRVTQDDVFDAADQPSYQGSYQGSDQPPDQGSDDNKNRELRSKNENEIENENKNLKGGKGKAKRPPVERHANDLLSDHIQQSYLKATGKPFPFSRNVKYLQQLREATCRLQGWTLDDLRMAVDNVFKSEIAITTNPARWLPRLEDYAAGPLNAFHDPKITLEDREAAEAERMYREATEAFERKHGESPVTALGPGNRTKRRLAR